MPDRKSLTCTLWLASSLVMLVSIAVAPDRASGSDAGRSGIDGHRLTFALSPDQPATSLTTPVPTDPVPWANAVPAEDEEQDRADALGEHPVSFLMNWWYCKHPGRKPLAPRSAISVYPLRC